MGTGLGIRSICWHEIGIAVKMHDIENMHRHGEDQLALSTAC